MDRNQILAETAKLTVSQRKAMRRLGATVKIGGFVKVTVYQHATTIHIRHFRQGEMVANGGALASVRGVTENLFVRFSPRGRILEHNQWTA